MADDVNSTPPASASAEAPASLESAEQRLREELRTRTWEQLGLERDASGLQALVVYLIGMRQALTGAPRSRGDAETRNLADVAWAMAVSALFREESRGAHCRTDFAVTDERFRGHTLLEAGRPRLADVDVPLSMELRC
jgi:aspartate oxidase